MKLRDTVIPAVSVVFQRDDEIFLLRRCNTGWRDGEYTVPSGHVERGESPLRAAIREAQEETGVILLPSHLKLSVVISYPGEREMHDRIGYFFIASKWQMEPINNEPQKCDAVSWFNIEALPEKTVPITRKGLAAIRAGKRYSEFGF